MLGRKGSLWARAERGGAPLVTAVIVVRHGALSSQESGESSKTKWIWLCLSLWNWQLLKAREKRDIETYVSYYGY